jgi:hypothetical protein
MGRKIKLRLKISKIIYHFHYERNVLAETLNVAHGISGFSRTLNTACLSQIDAS